MSEIVHGTLGLHKLGDNGDLVWKHGDKIVVSSHDFLIQACFVGMVHAGGKVVEGSFVIDKGRVDHVKR